MKLINLEPSFLRLITEKEYRHGVARDQADGIIFLCPKCFKENGGAAGTHRVVCWQPHVSTNVTPGPGRWRFEGEGFEDLSLVAGSSSILLTAGCRWHGFVKNGEVTGA